MKNGFLVLRILSKVPRYCFCLFLLKDATNSGGVLETPMTEERGARFLTPLSSTVEARINGRGETIPASQADRLFVVHFHDVNFLGNSQVRLWLLVKP